MNRVVIRNPMAIVSTECLASRLNETDIRIFDCTTILTKDETGQKPYIVESCRSDHDAGHIPGAGYLDIKSDFSSPGSPFSMTLPEPEHIASAFGRSGISNSSKVILYSRRGMTWSTRFWWMLKSIGFENASILDGGFDKWQIEGRPISTDPCQYPTGTLTVSPQRGTFVGKAEVLFAIGDKSTLIVNSLSEEQFAGQDPKFGRRGRILGSVNVPQKNLVDTNTYTFKTPEEIMGMFVAAGADKAEKFVTYCGSGIFASADAFWLYQLGHDNVAVYDNSLSEWAADPDLPMESDFPN